jgi:hypothetical protein
VKPGNGHILRPCGVAAVILLREVLNESVLPPFAAPALGLDYKSGLADREMAMSETTQQMIALWILFTHLLLVPWVLD